jgi:hypothetical protein
VIKSASELPLKNRQVSCPSGAVVVVDVVVVVGVVVVGVAVDAHVC